MILKDMLKCSERNSTVFPGDYIFTLIKFFLYLGGESYRPSVNILLLIVKKYKAAAFLFLYSVTLPVPCYANLFSLTFLKMDVTWFHAKFGKFP